MEEEINSGSEGDGGFNFKKTVSILAVIIAVIIILVLAFSLLSQKNNSLFGPGGEKINADVKIIKDGKIIAQFESDGNALYLKGSSNEGVRGKITLPKYSSGKTSGKITIKNPNGKITVLTSSTNIYVDENGQMVFYFAPEDLPELDEYYNEETGEYEFPEGFEYEATVEFVIEYEDTGETAIIEVPVVITFEEFIEKGCIALNRASVRETTHYGSLSLDTKMRILCETTNNVDAVIEWSGEKTGNVEIIFGNYSSSTVLTEYKKTIMPLPLQGEYSFKINFTPYTGMVGKKASFKINTLLGDDKLSIDFDVPIENLEQCIKVTPGTLVIPKNEDFAEFDIDLSSCSSERIEISMCDNDASCSGGTEGGIDLSKRAYTISPSSGGNTKIRVNKLEIPGAYGIPIYARVPGSEKTFIEEKIVEIEPFNGELVTPSKYQVSLIGTTKDSIRVHNYALAEDVDIDATICAVYNSSMGMEEGVATVGIYAGDMAGNSWWKSLAVDSDKYAGKGKYQAALVNTLAGMDYLRAVTQQTSMQKNYLIKTAYLNSTDLVSDSTSALEQLTTTKGYAQNLQDKLAEQNKYAQTDLASQIAGMVSTITSLSTSIGITDAEVATAATNVGLVTPCAAISGQITSANTAMTNAVEASTSTVGQIAGVVYAANSLYSLYNSIQALASDAETIDAASALNNINAALEKVTQISEKAQNAWDYMVLALASASIEGFTTAPGEDEDAKDYLEKAEYELESTLDLITEAKKTLLTAADDITVAIQDSDDQRKQLIIQAVSLLISLTEMSTLIQSDMSVIKSSLISANSALETALPIATQECARSGYGGGDSSCCAAEATIPTATASITAAMSSTAMVITQVMSLIGQVNSVYQAMRMYQQLVNNYATDYAQTQTGILASIQEINNLEATVNKAYNSLAPAISAAKWLSEQEVNSASGAEYKETVSLTGEYNKERLIGIISSAIMNGFVNGAYEGGVYTTENTFATMGGVSVAGEKTKNNSAHFSSMEEDCANRVKLRLPDFVINFWNDAKQLEISNPAVIAQWDFSDLQTFDVFEEQEAGITFSNNGLKKNSYGIVEINVDKHSHSQPTAVETKFGPFNIPDSQKEQLNYKYHFRFNAEPKKSKRFEEYNNNKCISGLLRGSSGKEATPRIVTSWDWNSVSSIGMPGSKNLTSAIVGLNNPKEAFIDSTQLSILLSKKIGSLATFLESTSAVCPENPAEIVLEKVMPVIVDSETGLPIDVQSIYDQDEEFCYLPLTTRTYDGKPALYYFLENSQITSNPEWFDDAEMISAASELEKLIDFNVFLIRDGYGIDFQADFVSAYSSKILLAGPSFLDPVNGAKKYFQDKDKAFFSSTANGLQQKTEWIIPDAGKYRVRMFIDFKDTAVMYTGSSASAKIIFVIDLIEPVNQDYSPWYYIPFDGFTGLNAANNRKSYGSALISAPEQFAVSKDEGAYVSLEQKDSLVKLSMKKISNFSLLNALPSLRGKILEVSYLYNPSTKKDDNSLIIFSPTVATPLLLELKGTEGYNSSLIYGVIRNGQDLTTNLNNMFVLDSVGDCSNLAGEKLSKYFKYSPDFGITQDFGVAMGTSSQSGYTYLKTTAYSPIEHSYSLRLMQNEKAYTPDDLLGINNPQTLNGVLAMPINDLGNNSIPDSLEKILEGVTEGTICVSSLGSKEIFWRPDSVLNEWENSSGKTLLDKEIEAAQNCAK